MGELWLANSLGDRCRVFWVEASGRDVLGVELRPGMAVYVTLGWVRPRQDGRWEWTFRPDRHGLFSPAAGTDKAQGVADCKVRARWRLVEIWTGKRVEDV